MGIFQRLVNLIKANINELLDRGEDPQIMIRLLVTEMEDSVIKATSALSKAMASETKLEKQKESATNKANDLENHARSAMEKGNEELARRILARKVQLDQQAANYGRMHAEADATVDHLRKQLDVLKGKLDEAKSRESMLVARAENAEARADIARQIGEIGDNSFADFERMEEKILEMESKAEAFEALSAEETSLEQEIQALENNADLESAFNKLKSEVGK